MSARPPSTVRTRHLATPPRNRTSAWSRCRPATPSPSSTTRSRGGEWRGGRPFGTQSPSTPSPCTSPSTRGSAAATGGARCCSAPAGSGSSWPRRTTSGTDDDWKRMEGDNTHKIHSVSNTLNTTYDDDVCIAQQSSRLLPETRKTQEMENEIQKLRNRIKTTRQPISSPESSP